MTYALETKRRRTFAIISHPDAGKTTLTEKLLLFSGAIQIAGSVKARKATRHALDGVYVTSGERLTFRRLPPPTVAALEKLVHVISQRVGRALERQGILVRDLENNFLAVDTPDGTDFDDLLGHSITYRIALGPHQGRKAFTLQTVPAATDAIDGKLARAAGFSLHAGVACEAHEREKLERLCRYITRRRSLLSGCH